MATFKGFAMKKLNETGWVEKEVPVCGPIDAILRPTCVSPCTSDIHTVWEGAIGDRKDTVCYFENVVGDNIFMVADSPDGNKLRNITAPFYTDNDGNIRKFIPQKEHKQTFTLNKRKKKLDQEHTLHFWDTEKERFIPLEYASSTDTTQTYDQEQVRYDESLQSILQ